MEFEPLFRVLWDGGVQPVGAPLQPGTGKVRIELSPTQLIRLQQELTPKAIHALMLVIEHGYRPGQRTEIEGWGIAWLEERGMPRYRAVEAARELTVKGYVRSERLRGAPNGRKLGVVPGGLIEDVEDVPGVPRTDGRPRRRPLGGVDSAVHRGVCRDPANTARPVDNQVSRVPANTASRSAEPPHPQPTTSQVSGVVGVPAPPLSTAPTSGEEGRKEDLLLPTPAGPLARERLHAFLTQPALRARLTRHWEVSVAALARVFVAHPDRASRVLTALGEQDTGQTADVALAQLVVDLLRATPAEQVQAATQLAVRLRTLGVQVHPQRPDETLLTAFLLAVIASLDVPAVRSWGGWFGGGLTRAEWIPSPTLVGALDAMSRVLRDDPLPPLPPPGPAPESSGDPADPPAPPPLSPSYVERLRRAVDGTVWEDDTMFDKLLRNPARQEWVLRRWEMRQQDAG